MIRTESFAVSRETFAAERKQVLNDAAEQIRAHVAEALSRVGLPGWERPIISEALDLFDLTARNEVDAWGPVLDDMHDAFAEELAKALKATKKAPAEMAQVQADTITRWVAQMAHNAGIEAAVTSDPDEGVGLEWVTMQDSDVRSPHAEASGQTVPTGHEFEVGGEKMLYPGQPVGNPSNWINCRCLARPTMLSEASVSRETFGADDPQWDGLKDDLARMGAQLVDAEDDDVSRETSAGTGNASDPGLEEGEEPKAAVVVLRPRVDDPVASIASGTHPHCTLLYLGDGTIDLAPLNAIVESIAKATNALMTDRVSGRAVLGDDEADVLLLDGSASGQIRATLMAEDGVLELLGMQEQYPSWIPHLTLGYPAAPAVDGDMPTQITYDLLSVWRGNETYDYPLGGAVPEKKVVHPEDPEFTQEMADAFFASVPAAAPVEDAEPAEAAPAADAPDETLRPWHGVLAPEGAPSGDKRGFAARMLTMRDLPLPLKAQFVDDEGHKGSVVVGRIDAVYRDGGLIKAAGVWDNSEDADRAWGMIDRKMWRGVSVDLDAVEGEMIEASEDGGKARVEFTEGRVCSSTLCAIPAFAEAFIRNGTWAEFANEPMPTGAMVEIPDWTEEPNGALVASATATISADYFRNPMLSEPTPVTRGENGLIFGHLGIWDECHIAYEVCTTVPPSETDYAYFLTGQVFTDAGPVAVGQLTVGGGHADMKLGVRAAIAHYDNVANAVADITVGEDDHGVWFSGRIRPWATEQQIHEMFAAGPSGDWRGVRYRGMDSMELVAAHAVNVPGFPVTRTRFAVENGRQTALVAAGMIRDRAKEAEEVFSDLRSMQVSDVFNEISTMKGK